MELVDILSSPDELRDGYRHWIGNDSNRSHHHGLIPRAEGTVDLRLQWRADAQQEPRDVACLRLHMESLLKAGFVRLDGDDYYRLRFAREDGEVFLQVRPGEPILKVGGA